MTDPNIHSADPVDPSDPIDPIDPVDPVDVAGQVVGEEFVVLGPGAISPTGVVTAPPLPILTAPLPTPSPNGP